MALPSISVSGWMRSGKDTIANYLIERYGYKRLSFAGPLKREVARGIGCAPEDLDEEPLRSQVRRVLQVWGTEFRRGQDDLYWVRQTEKDIDSQAGPFTIADARFINELAMLRRRGFLLVKVDMPVEQVIEYLHEQGWQEHDIHERLNHPSEQQWQTVDFDIVIPSIRGNIQGLYDAIEEVLRQHGQE